MLLDRIDERDALDRLVDAASGGLSGALVLHGEAGMGKTALLDYTVSSCQSLRVLRITGVEAEREFGFAALHRLLAPLLGDMENLPVPQRNALESAFGLVTRAPADLFLVGLASLTLLADSASPEGLLCIVDDAQWVDPESLNVLAFVGRRLRAEGLALIFGYRTSDEVSSVLAGVPDLPVGGLPEQAALELLSSTADHRLDAGAARRIVTETSGCPLALLELGAYLTPTQLAGTEPLPIPIPISDQLEEHFSRQVETLPPATQLFLLVAATETSGELNLVRKVAHQLGCQPDVEEIAIRQRLIVTDPRVEFRHPLIRSAIYASASFAKRRDVHRALANSIDKSVEPDRWARHIAASATGPDDRLAADLESVAHTARGRGGYAAEASLLAQAAELTEGSAHRCQRLLDAATAAMRSGVARKARSLLKQARAGLNDPLLVAEAIRLEGQLAWAQHRPALLLEAARRFLPLDVDRARGCAFEAVNWYLTAQHYSQDFSAAEVANMARETREGSTKVQLGDLLVDGVSLLLSGRQPEATEVLREAGTRLHDGPNSDDEISNWFNCGTFVANELMDERAYAVWAEHVESVARQQGALHELRSSLLAISYHHVRAGQFSAASANLAEMLEITAAIGGRSEIYQPFDAMVLAWRGDSQRARNSARQLIEVGSLAGSAQHSFFGYYSLATLELSSGNYSAALVAAEQITKEKALDWRNSTLPIVVEAGVRSGNRIAAEHALAELEVRATSTGTLWALGLLARCRAHLADDSDAGDLFEDSISQLQQTLVVTDLALAHLSYGEWLRRQQRRIDARTQLRTAHDLLSSMGAAGFAERARTELLATGERVSRRTVQTQTELTAQELQIAQLASRGATNPEIATKLFLSASTVDYHLRKVFRKLGISSRRQLTDSLPT